MRFFVTIIAVISTIYNAYAAELTSNEKTAKHIINQQIQAFLRDDDQTAFTFAAPGVRAIFRTSDTFMEMVKRSYHPIYRPRTYRFGKSIEENNNLAQLVMIEDEDGDAYEALYQLSKGSDGIWKIAAVSLRKIPGHNI